MIPAPVDISPAKVAMHAAACRRRQSFALDEAARCMEALSVENARLAQRLAASEAVADSCAGAELRLEERDNDLAIANATIEVLRESLESNWRQEALESNWREWKQM